MVAVFDVSRSIPLMSRYWEQVVLVKIDQLPQQRSPSENARPMII
jgi:hypothetical protein